MTSAPSQPLRVMLVDDHAVVRRGLRDLLSERADITVVGEAGTVKQALDDLGHHGMNITQVTGRGAQRGIVHQGRIALQDDLELAQRGQIGEPLSGNPGEVPGTLQRVLELAPIREGHAALLFGQVDELAGKLVEEDQMGLHQLRVAAPVAPGEHEKHGKESGPRRVQLDPLHPRS